MLEKNLKKIPIKKKQKKTLVNHDTRLSILFCSILNDWYISFQFKKWNKSEQISSCLES